MQSYTRFVISGHHKELFIWILEDRLEAHTNTPNRDIRTVEQIVRIISSVHIAEEIDVGNEFDSLLCITIDTQLLPLLKRELQQWRSNHISHLWIDHNFLIDEINDALRHAQPA